MEQEAVKINAGAGVTLTGPIPPEFVQAYLAATRRDFWFNVAAMAVFIGLLIYVRRA